MATKMAETTERSRAKTESERGRRRRGTAVHRTLCRRYERRRLSTEIMSRAERRKGRKAEKKELEWEEAGKRWR